MFEEMIGAGRDDLQGIGTTDGAVELEGAAETKHQGEETDNRRGSGEAKVHFFERLVDDLQRRGRNEVVRSETGTHGKD